VKEGEPTPESRARSDARRAALYKTGIVGIVIGTFDGRIVEINDALVQMVGYEKEEILSGRLDWRSLTPPEWRDGDDRAADELRARGVIAPREKEYIHKSGRRVPVLIGSALIAGSAGEILSYVVDLSAQRRTAAEVERLRDVRSEAMFRGLLEAAPDAVVVIDSAGKIVLVNGKTEDLFGYARVELLGQSVDALVPARLRGPHSAHRTAFFAAPRARAMGEQLELFGLRKDGSEFPVEISLSPFETPGGVLVSASIRDITQRRRAEEQRARLAAIVDASSDAIIGKTLDGTVTSWNEAAERLFGYAPGEILGRPITTLVPSRLLGEETEILTRLARGERIEQLDTIRRTKDGREVDVSVTISPVRDSRGSIVGAAKVVRDVTARRRANEAVAHAKDAAEAANRELEAFSYSVAHDLRAPLRGMNGFAQVLLTTYGDRLDAEGRDYLQEIVLNAAKMAELIDGLLALARVTRSEVRREHVDISALAHEVTNRLATSEPERHVDVRVEEGLTADADVRLVRALFENLLGNAWKFTSKAATSRIEVGATQEDGGHAFFVRDNGAGFDMAHAGKLFAPFQRLHTLTEFPGTGIGLATVRRIVHRHGGQIRADGAVGSGATFTFTLPSGEGGSA